MSTAVHHASMYAKGGGGASGGAQVGKSTGATAGTPGTFSPAGSRPPASLTDLLASPITATPGTAWTNNQYVVCRNGDQVRWTGTVWAAIAPSTGATAGIPGSFTPAGSLTPADVASLIAGVPVAVTASPPTAWTTGQYVQTRTAGAPGQAHWSGTAWVSGVA